MYPLKIIKKLAIEIMDQKTSCPDFVRQRLIWAFVAGWEKGISYKKGNTPVIKMNEYGKTLDIYESLHEAARKNGIHNQGINAVCKGRMNTHGGFYWRYVENPKQIKKIIEGWQEKL